MIAVRRLIAFAICLAGGSVGAEPHVLRLASVVPDGSGFARELKALAAEMEQGSSGRVRVKLYLGAMTGDELHMVERVRRDQLDGWASAGMACEQVSQSMKVMRMPGLFESHDDARSVLSRLKPVWDKEFLESGYRNLAETVVGAAIPLARYPDRTFEQMKKRVWWVWDADHTMKDVFPVLGLKTLALPIYEAARAYEEGRVDGFTMTPSGALAFQWSSTAKYYINLPLAWVTGCMAISSRAFDQLDFADQQVLLGAAAKAAARIEDVGREMDQQLLGGLFKRQGLVEVQLDPSFRQVFHDNARRARAELARREVPQALLDRVEGLLAEVHGHHGR
jgi:TRAP-type C4-dicarboxylate transport system substrate-binding protein